jgi:hypothetical protein
MQKLFIIQVHCRSWFPQYVVLQAPHDNHQVGSVQDFKSITENIQQNQPKQQYGKCNRFVRVVFDIQAGQVDDYVVTVIGFGVKDEE